MSNSFLDKVVQHSPGDNDLEPEFIRVLSLIITQAKEAKELTSGLIGSGKAARRYYRKHGIGEGW